MRRLPRVQQAVLDVLIERGRAHAYEIRGLLKGQVGGASVYAALSSLQAKGYVMAEWELPEERETSHGGPPRKYFELTADGRRALAATQEQTRLASRRRGPAALEVRL
jgi:DNA-binding PadR family transcriptional regulator